MLLFAISCISRALSETTKLLQFVLELGQAMAQSGAMGTLHVTVNLLSLCYPLDGRTRRANR